MALVMRPDPFTTEVNRLFSNLFEPSSAEGRRWTPPIDLIEAEDHFLLRADLPGVTEDSVAIEVQDGTLTVSGHREAEHEAKEQGWYRLERAFGSFSRSIALPEGIDADAVGAAFDKGVLEVTIPKPAERKPHRVAINGRQPAIEGTAED